MRLIRGMEGEQIFIEKPREFIQFCRILPYFSEIHGVRAHGHRPPGTPDAARAMVAPDANPGAATTPPKSPPGTGRLRLASPARRETSQTHGALPPARGEGAELYAHARNTLASQMRANAGSNATNAGLSRTPRRVGEPSPAGRHDTRRSTPPTPLTGGLVLVGTGRDLSLHSCLSTEQRHRNDGSGEFRAGRTFSSGIPLGVPDPSRGE